MKPSTIPVINTISPVEYHVGGSLLANDPTYVERKADRELYETVKLGKFCYVFNSRQMGKSSVRVRVMQQLEAEGVVCISIDLSSIGSSQEVTPKKWYAAVIRNIISSCHLGSEINLRSWLRERDSFTLMELLGSFIETVLLEKVSQKIVIFFDEIDSILSLQDFSRDDFFAFIRSCYNVRTDKPAYRRLTFVLIGVANPSDLMQDKKRTPFNIGDGIDLTGFTLEEVKEPLGQGLIGKAAHPERVLREILRWTGGQPFLTQKLCRMIQTADSPIMAGEEAESIAQLVQERILYQWKAQDVPEHLKTIRDRLIRDDPGNPNPRKGRILALYQRVLQEGEIDASESLEEIDLRLSGLVVKREGKIQPRNPIYQAIFDLSWVETELANLRPYADALKEWLQSDRENEFCLLRGETLKAAKAWAEGKILSDDDYQFLDASRELEKREVEAALKIEQDAKQKAISILLRVRQKAHEMRRKAKNKARRTIVKAKWRMWRLVGIGCVCLMGSLVFAKIAINDANREKRIRELELKSMTASRQFKNKQQIKALVQGMEAAQELKKLAGKQVDQALTTEPITVLQTILNGIQEQHQFPLDYIMPHQVVFNPDGESLAVVKGTGELQFWNPQGEQIKELKQFSYIRFLRFSHDGESLVTAENQVENGTVWIRDSQGEKKRELPGQGQKVYSVDFSPDDQQIVTASKDGQIRLYSRSDQLLNTFTVDQVQVAVFSPKGLIVTLDENNSIKLWETSGKLTAELDKTDSYQFIAFDFSSDGEHFITSSDDGKIRFWSWSGELLKNFEASDTGISSLYFSPDHQLITGIDGNGIARLWTLEGQSLAEFRGGHGGISHTIFHPNGQELVTVKKDGLVQFWNITKLFKTQLSEHQNEATGEFSANHSILVTAGAEGNVLIRNQQGQILQKFEGEPGDAYSVSISPDGKRVVQGGSKGKVRLRNLSTGKTFEFQGHKDWSRVLDVSFSPDGQTFVTAGEDWVAKLWDLSGSGKPLATFAHNWWIWEASFSPDGKYIATAGVDGRVKIWERSGKRVGLVRADRDTVFTVGFHPTHSQQIATAGKEGIIRFWNWEEQPAQPLGELKGHDDWIYSLSYSPDGQQLATVSIDGTARVWDVDSKQEIEKVELGQIQSRSVSFSPDGQQIAIGRSDGLIQLWQPSAIGGLDQLLAQGCNWLENYLIKNPIDLVKLESCHEPTILTQAAPNLVKQAEKLAKQGDKDGAIKYFAIAQSWNPSTVSFEPNKEAERLANIGEAKDLKEEAQALVGEEDYEKALEKYDSAIQLDPNLIEAIRERGDLYRVMQRYEEALVDLKTSLQDDQENALAIFRRGQTYFRLRRYEEALADFNQASKINPELKWLVFANQGQTYLWMRRYQDALAAFNDSIELQPNFLHAHYYQFVAYQMLKQPDKAQNSLAQGIKIVEEEYNQHPNSDFNIRTLALFYVAADNVNKAKPLYQTLLDKNPSEYTIRLGIRDLSDFLYFFPDNQDAKSLEALLESHLQETQNSPYPQKHLMAE